MDSLAHDEPTQRVEPGAAPARDDAHPSRPVRSGTLVAPPPPGLVALSVPADTDTPWRRPDDPPSPPRVVSDHPSPQPVPVVPASPQPVGGLPASPQPVAGVPASPRAVAGVPLSPQPVANPPASPQPVANPPASPRTVPGAPASPQAAPEDLEARPVMPEPADGRQTDPHEHSLRGSAAPQAATQDPATPQEVEPTPARSRAAEPDTAPLAAESDPAPDHVPSPEGAASPDAIASPDGGAPSQEAEGSAQAEASPQAQAWPQAGAWPQADDPVTADLGEDSAADLEPEHTSGRANPAWLGEPTGGFDLDLPELGGRNPSWLGEPTRRPDPDEPFDQYALPDDASSAAALAAPPVPERPAAAPGQVRGARNAVTVDLANPQDGPGELPDGDSGLAAPGSAPGSAAALAPLPAGHRPTAAGVPHTQASGISAPTEAFTMPVQEVPRESWIDPRLHGGRRRQEAAPARKRAKRPRPPRRAGVAMPLLILFGLVAAFFSWVSAEPLWLAVGHGKTGTLTVTSCAGSGLLQRCVGEFATPARDFTADSVSVLGPPGQAEGLSAPARMVGAGSHRAYVTNGTGGLHLRWMVGLSIVLFCSICIVFATGALRLPGRHERLAAVGLSFAGPLLITIGFLAATF
ncbi:hypothetical protein [Catellatospora citrea]|uniref:hypothetical protein n=1 Tax=Catellatospora citrea TaxID=53366 RepID=UPI000E759134|nr:hypothetical protein [Catellatospora citrea]RKE09325.1 hypothetical protein C8E86_4210 [Catellatospora citrea]